MREKIYELLTKNTHSDYKIDENGSIKVFEIVSNQINQETFFEMKFNLDKKEWELYRVIRHNSQLLKVFTNEDSAYLALVTIVVKYSSAPKFVKADLEDKLDSFHEGDIHDIEKEINRVIHKSFYSIFIKKAEAVNLEKQGSNHCCVSFVESNGNSILISDVNEDFSDGLNIMYNFAWYLQLLDYVIQSGADENVKSSFLELQKVKEMLLGIYK
ncbi:MAG: hypothetical protein ACI4XL_12875 [Bacillus sp. (in: firmicutes)]